MTTNSVNRSQCQIPVDRCAIAQCLGLRAPRRERVRGISNLGVLARAAILGAMPRPVDPVEDGPVRIARLILLVSLVPALLLTLVTGLSDPRYLQVTAGLGVGLALVWWMASPLAARGWNPNWLLVLASANFFLLTPELALRAAGFRYESGIEFGYPRPSHFVAFEPHRKLFWTLRPGSEGGRSHSDVKRPLLLLGASSPLRIQRPNPLDGGAARWCPTLPRRVRSIRDHLDPT